MAVDAGVRAAIGAMPVARRSRRVWAATNASWEKASRIANSGHHSVMPSVVKVLGEGDQAIGRQGLTQAETDAGEPLLPRHDASSLAMTRCWISLVPSPISKILESQKNRATGCSIM